MITGNVRHNASRPPDLYNNLIIEIQTAWDTIVGATGSNELRGIVLVGGLVAGFEAGLFIPPAGKDGVWLRDNIVTFQKKADEGREDFRETLIEIETREDLRASM
jgi:hypothetical protein